MAKKRKQSDKVPQKTRSAEPGALPQPPDHFAQAPIRAERPIANPPVANPELLANAAIVLAIAGSIAVLMALVALKLPQGEDALAAIGGTFTNTVEPRPARWMLFLDTLFPVFYGSGLALFFTGLRTRANRALVRIILLALFAGVLSDFAENALMYRIMLGDQPSGLAGSLTIMKYGGLAFGAVAGSALIAPVDPLSQAVRIGLRYVFPVVIAIVISRLGEDAGRLLAGLSFVAILFLLAAFAQKRSLATP